MANRIKGITMEIGGDTTGPDKALKCVNSSITKTQSDLNDGNRLLKLDPSNMVLVAQKQELLAQAVSQTEEKLSILDTVDDGQAIQTVIQQLNEAGDTAENTTDDVGEITENTKGAVLMQTADQQSAVGDKIQEIGDKVLNVYMDEVEENGRR